MKSWDGTALSGLWIVTYKIDGVRGISLGDVVVSRAGKEIKNLPAEVPKDFEIFTGSWSSTISAISLVGGDTIPKECLYSLQPLDKRLFCCTIEDPSAEDISSIFEMAMTEGYEGLVLRQKDVWLKVKSSETYDVEVTALIEGKGRNTGRLGSFQTPLGRVGTGLTDADRETFKSLPIGTTIEVECMELTPAGKFRHPRFVRVRWDK